MLENSQLLLKQELSVFIAFPWLPSLEGVEQGVESAPQPAGIIYPLEFGRNSAAIPVLLP